MSQKINILTEYDEKYTIYKKFSEEIKRQIEIFMKEEKIPYTDINYRVKERDSLSGKITKKNNKYNCLDDITDIAGVRIITYYSDDVDRVADIVEKEFCIDKENSIDKRKSLEPDRFGYCSVHYVVGMSDERLKLREYRSFKGLKCEIQIRTVLQHAWSEIEHDLGYKSMIAIPQDIRRSFSRLAGLLEIADKEFLDIRQFLLSYQKDIAEKIENNTINANAVIDAILLEELIKTNKEIININDQILNISNRIFEETSDTWHYDTSIHELQWFGINTMEQLNDFIKRNEKTAVEIANIYLSKKASDLQDKDELVIHRTIAFFYLCYAELVNNTKKYNKQSIMQYLEDNNIGEDREAKVLATQKLLNVRKQLQNEDRPT